MTRRHFQRLYPPTILEHGPAHWLVFVGDDVLLPDGVAPGLLEGTVDRPHDVVVPGPRPLGLLDGRPVMFGAVEAAAAPEGWQRLSLRSVLAQAGAVAGGLFGYAWQILHWERTSAFCPACGHATRRLDGWGKTCPACGHTRYPPVSPVAIVLIHDGGGRLLLANKAGFGARYSLVAGFIEPGETVEQCAAREVREEVGVEIEDVRYVGSQPWPFPHQLMIGVTARYAGGEIVVDTSELADARWFSLDALPELPPPFSIARQMIDAWRARVDGP